MPDENDIIFNQYSLDFFGLIDLIYKYIAAIGSGGGFSVSTDGGWTELYSTAPSMFIEWLVAVWGVLVVLSWLVSALLLFGLVYAYIRHGQLGEAISEILKNQEEAFAKQHKKDKKGSNTRWIQVQEHVAGPNPNEWKLSIIEADIMLGDLLEVLGYAGTTIGEKLKSASPTSFKSINHAWRAHNIRNRIAHEGSNFELTKREAQETITLYKMVFEEFNFI